MKIVENCLKQFETDKTHSQRDWQAEEDLRGKNCIQWHNTQQHMTDGDCDLQTYSAKGKFSDFILFYFTATNNYILPFFVLFLEQIFSENIILSKVFSLYPLIFKYVLNYVNYRVIANS